MFKRLIEQNKWSKY